MQAKDAQPGDLVRSEDDGQYYLAPDGNGGWSTMQPIPYFGPPEATAPDGELVLFGRGGEPVGP